MKIKALPSQERLKELFNYDHNTGDLTWLISCSSRAPAGSIAGSRSGRRYLTVNVDGQAYLAHRLIWMWVTGEDPEAFFIDHIDRDTANNRFNNLRLASKALNKHNSPKNRNNTSGYKGVSFSKQRQMFRATITKDGKQTNLGFFSTPEEAYQVYCQAADNAFHQ